jgi:hypothetical protein
MRIAIKEFATFVEPFSLEHIKLSEYGLPTRQQKWVPLPVARNTRLQGEQS